jgi:hypothetical protein
VPTLDRRADVLVAALLLVAAAMFRLPRLDLVVLNADTIGPYLRAWTILNGDGLLPPSHAPESGPALYWISTLFLVGADGLHEAFGRRYLLQALIAPGLYLALVRPAGRGGALLVGMLLAWSPGLIQTLDSGYHGYLAPDVAAVVVAGLFLGLGGEVRGRPIAAALPAVPLAMMCHPLAVALLPPICVAAGLAWRDDPKSRRALLVGSAVAVALGAVRLVQLAGAPGDGFLWDFATSNASGDGPLAVVLGSLAAVPRQDGGLTAVVMAVPLLGLHPGAAAPVRRLAAGYFLATGTMCVAGAVIGYLQPYHYRILFPFAACLIGLAFGLGTPSGSFLHRRSLPIGALSLLALLGAAASADVPDRGPSDLEMHRDLGARIAGDAADGHWIEFATVGTSSWGSPAALVLDGILAGRSIEPLRRAGPLYLVIAGPSEALSIIDGVSRPSGVAPIASLDGAHPVRLVRLDGPSRSRPWTRAVCEAVGPSRLRVERRSADWLAFVRPGFTDEFATRWFDPCVVGGPPR